ncbi:MAG TPA: hypothetical protein VIV65_01100 [Gemmatimonadaceae bacterium]|jgi:hypothetical protein
MDQPPSSALQSLPQVRERVVQQLTQAFAHDLIGVEELERRLEHVYQTQSVAEAEAVVLDLKAAAATGSLPAPPSDQPRQSLDVIPNVTSDRFVAILSSSERRGPWVVPQRLEARAVFADSTIDLTQAALPGDIIDIHVKVFAANMEIIVPAGLRVVNRVGAFLANVETSPSLDLAPMVPGQPVVRITGYATMANLEIIESEPSDR